MSNSSALENLGGQLGPGFSLLFRDIHGRVLGSWPDDTAVEPLYRLCRRHAVETPDGLQQWLMEGDGWVLICQALTHNRQLWVLGSGDSRTLGKVRIALNKHLPRLNELPAEPPPPDGSRLRAEERSARMLLFRDGREMFTVSPSLEWALSISSEVDHTLQIWSLPDGKKSLELPLPTEIRAVHFSNEGSTCALLGDEVYLYDNESEHLQSFPGVSNLVLSSHAERIVVTDKTHYCRVLERVGQKLITQFHPYPAEVSSWKDWGAKTKPPEPGPYFSALALHGDRLAGGIYLKPYLDIWRLPAVERLTRLELDSFPREAKMSERYTACRTPQKVWVLDNIDGEVKSFDLSARSIALHPSKPVMAVVTRDYENFEISLENGELWELPRTFFAVDFSVDGSWMTDHGIGVRVGEQAPEEFPFAGSFEEQLEL